MHTKLQNKACFKLSEIVTQEKSSSTYSLNSNEPNFSTSKYLFNVGTYYFFKIGPSLQDFTNLRSFLHSTQNLWVAEVCNFLCDILINGPLCKVRWALPLLIGMWWSTILTTSTIVQRAIETDIINALCDRIQFMWRFTIIAIGLPNAEIVQLEFFKEPKSFKVFFVQGRQK